MTVRIQTPHRHWNRWLAVLIIALAIVFTVSIFCKPAAAKSSCGSIQSRVDAAKTGATVNLPDGCVYREDVEIRKPLKLVGGPGVQIRGSKVWTGWKQSGSHWVKGTLPRFGSGGKCKPGTSRCKWPEQVFFDGKPLLQVASGPRAGQFAVNSSRQVILANNPAGHVVEVSMRERWITGYANANGVTIEGFTMKHAANPAQTGAIRNNAHNNWTVRNNDLSYAHGANVALGAAAGLSIVGNDIHHGGQYGITGSKAFLEVRDNEIHHNNTEDFDTRWAAGGIKIASANRLLVDGNEIYHNNGDGAWSDIGSENVTYSNNRVHHNRLIGLHVEITDHIEVFGNEVWENGWGAPAGAGDPGIILVACRDAEVYNNTLAWNNDGISVVNSLRNDGFGGTDPRFDRVNDVHVHDNTIVSEDYVAGDNMLALQWRRTYSGGNLYDPAANNRGNDNRYWYYSPEGIQERFLWTSNLKTLAAFNATRGEEGGRYLSAAQKSQVLDNRNIPARPKR